MKTYSEEFKLDAVKRALESPSAAAVARELGINENTLYAWMSKYQKRSGKEQVFPGSGHLSPEDERIRQLEKENRDLKEEVEILKKAAAFFAKNLK